MKKSIFITALAMAISSATFAQDKADGKYIIPTTNNKVHPEFGVMAL